MTRRTQADEKARGRKGTTGGANGAPPRSDPAPLNMDEAFRRISARRGVEPVELFTEVVERGLVAQAEGGAGWAVKLLVDHLCPPEGETAPEPETPLSPEAGRLIYEIVRSEREGS